MAGDHWSVAAGDNKLRRREREAEEDARLQRIIAQGIAEGIAKALREKEKK